MNRAGSLLRALLVLAVAAVLGGAIALAARPGDSEFRETAVSEAHRSSAFIPPERACRSWVRAARSVPGTMPRR
jgi:hypothetical protein